MFRKVMAVIAGLLMTMGIAFAQVDVNQADQAALDGVKGIGPKISKSIVDERTKNGKFKDWADFEQRVKGVGEKNAAKMSANGLTVNGTSLATAGSATGPKAKASGSSGTAATSESGTTKKKSRKSSKSTSGSSSGSDNGK